MLVLFAQFPEMVFVDGTYKVNKYGFPLYHVMIQDNLGRGRTVFYAFVSNETAPMLSRMMAEFRSFVGDVERVKTAMVDCDQNEILAIREHLPNASVQLCTFHVLKNMKKRVAELLLPAQEKTRIFRLCRDLLYSQSLEEFERRLMLVNEANAEIGSYLRNSWCDDAEMWVAFHRKQVITFGNDTNNIMESENGKIKHVLCSSSSQSSCRPPLKLRSKTLTRLFIPYWPL